MSDQPTLQEIDALQGTRKSEVPPWMSYAAEFEEKIDPQLQAEIDEYAQHRYASTSSQNKEELHRQQELNEDISKQYQWIHPNEYKQEGARVGRVLHSDVFINTLRKQCNLRVWYREHPHLDKLTLVYSDSFGSNEPQVACWVQRGYMPEFSFVRFDRYGVPLNERRRGWRTCLLQMILKGLLDEKTAHKAFGAATGPASDRYNSTLYEWRKQQFQEE